ncbi:tetratricopeptide repeat-containing diguanylate cyclase [Roseateles oligotrophus]|uniref:diguanylate cyclase n=1 Tax=Roseateles oligotrophus TaxID=1769250 RepID=A0ABT2YCM1_9BURK|nr:tetratricopeptide repeat-containing diguanylate cyclase [Roseateles oligotrophus]MCV2367787.1 diguanylate cyclase [Roseateles oligotrophus]
MQDLRPSEVSGEQIVEWLVSARAQKQVNLDLGLRLATQAWSAAGQRGYVAEHLEAGILRAFFLFRHGDMAAMLVAAQALLPGLREQGNSAALCELLRWMAFASAEVGEFEMALGHVNESLARARQMDNKALIAIALNAVGACLERMGDPWQAERLMNEAMALLGGAANDFELMVSHNNLATVALGMFHLLRHGKQADHQREAADALQRARHHAGLARPYALTLGDGFLLALSDGNCGEVLLHLDELEESEKILKATLARVNAHRFTALGWRVRCSLAELDLRRGRAADAAHELDVLLAEAAGLAQQAVWQRLQYAAYRAHKALGDDAKALAHLELYQAAERHRTVAQLKAQARFVVSRIEAERALGGDTPAAERADADAEAGLRDPLTGLGTRRGLELRLPALMRSAEQRGAALTLALVDIDRLAEITTRHGESVANHVLQVLAQMLRDNTRGSDLLLRLEAEQILMVLPDTIADRAFEVCERLRQTVEQYPWARLAEGLDVTLSIGLANAPPYATDLLLGRAESAMYRAKHLGRNRVALA